MLLQKSLGTRLGWEVVCHPTVTGRSFGSMGPHFPKLRGNRVTSPTPTGVSWTQPTAVGPQKRVDCFNLTSQCIYAQLIEPVTGCFVVFQSGSNQKLLIRIDPSGCFNGYIRLKWEGTRWGNARQSTRTRLTFETMAVKGLWSPRREFCEDVDVTWCYQDKKLQEGE